MDANEFRALRASLGATQAGRIVRLLAAIDNRCEDHGDDPVIGHLAERARARCLEFRRFNVADVSFVARAEAVTALLDGEGGPTNC